MKKFILALLIVVLMSGSAFAFVRDGVYRIIEKTDLGVEITGTAAVITQDGNPLLAADVITSDGGSITLVSANGNLVISPDGWVSAVGADGLVPTQYRLEQVGSPCSLSPDMETDCPDSIYRVVVDKSIIVAVRDGKIGFCDITQGLIDSLVVCNGEPTATLRGMNIVGTDYQLERNRQ